MRNMKRFSKILAVLLCVVLAVGVVFTLSSCNKCDHANVTKQNTATCTAAGVEASVCNDCGETISETPVDALGHTYQADAAASVAVTCTADGKNVEKCTRCGDVKETVISKLNHNFQLDATKCVFATCTASGLEVKTCANCSALSSTILPALNHNFVENGESVAATCTTAGKTVIECTRADCHEKNETPINALGHDWDIPAGTVAVACLDVNCKRCDAVQVATEPHSYGGVATVNHCDKPGTETRTCTLCRHEEVVEIPSIAHNVPT